jgi:UDP-N-acetylmuramyl pentapeptide phosphotransferase/UDP-N-acetylglucosamine-1-phosphate transferase
MLDIPNERSSHTLPVPRGGGVAVAVAVTAALTLGRPTHPTSPYWLLLVVLPAVMCAIGLADDLRSLSPFLRLGAEGVAALVLLVKSGVFTGHGVTTAALLALMVAVLWEVGFVNAFNFMDGVNGLAAVAALIGGAAYVVVGHRSGKGAILVGGAVLAASALAFLPFNFPRASLFLGDTGSYFWGASLATLALLSLHYGLPIEAVIGPLVPFALDTSFTLLRRVSSGQCWYASHRDHLYQRISQSGWSHVRVTTLLAGLMLLCAAAGVGSTSWGPAGRAVADSLALLGLVFYVVYGLRALPSQPARPTPIPSG